jgi:hypothetical protein
MQNRYRSSSWSQLSALLLGAGLLGGCVKEISSEERLDRETNSGPVKPVASPAELAKVNCLDAGDALAKARSDKSAEADRLVSYRELFTSLRKRSQMFEDAMARNPDLAYQEGSQALVSAQETCIQQAADVRVEFDSYVRELVKVPTVQDVKGNTVARLDFDTLREAIETLDPEDKEQLLNRVASAEKTVETKEKKKGK